MLICKVKNEHNAEIKLEAKQQRKLYDTNETNDDRKSIF